MKPIQNKIPKPAFALLLLMAFALSSLAQEVHDTTAYQRKITSSYLDAFNQQLLGNDDEAIKKYETHLDKYPDDAAAFYQLARIYSARPEPGLAAEYARRAATLDPENDWYKLLLADIYKNQGQMKQALELMQKLVKKNPENLEYIERLALAFAVAGDYEKALQYYQMLEDKTDISEELSLQKQKLWLLLGDSDKAIEEIIKLSQRYPNKARYYSMLAELYLKQEKPDKALEAYKKVKELDPENQYIHISLADFYMKQEAFEPAFRELRKGFAVPSLSIDSKIQLILTYYSALSNSENFLEELVALSRILVETHPDDPKSYSVYGDMLNQLDKKEEARDAYEKVITLDSSRYFIWEQLLFIYNGLNENDKLQSYSTRASELFPLQPLPYLFQGIAAFVKKDYEQSVSALAKGVQYVYDNDALLEQFYIFLGDAYNETGNHEKSTESYNKVLSINPENAYVMNNYSYHLAEKGMQLNKAYQMAKMANQIEKDNASYMDTFGWVLYKQGKYEEAAKWLKKALKLSENNGVLLEHYGDILFKLGKTSKALKYWEKALENGGHSDLLEKKIRDKKLYEAQ